MIKHFRDLDVYRKSQELYPRVIEFTKEFSREGYHLRDQLCRAANAIHSNIAEGFGRSEAEFKMYLTRALGSCNETVNHINDAINARFGNNNLGKVLFEEYERLGKQLYRLREKWKKF